MNKHLTSKLLTLLLLLFFVACSNEETPWKESSTGTGRLTNVITETSLTKEDLAEMVVNFVAGRYHFTC